MAVEKILLKRGDAASSAAYAGEEREVTVDLGEKTLRVHDGTTAGGTAQALKSEVPEKLSDLTDDVGIWTKENLTALSQLTDDVGYWKTSVLTSVSQLANDAGYAEGNCTYCSYCSYCSQCSRCNSVQCTQVKCSKCLDCTKCS